MPTSLLPPAERKVRKKFRGNAKCFQKSLRGLLFIIFISRIKKMSVNIIRRFGLNYLITELQTRKT